MVRLYFYFRLHLFKITVFEILLYLVPTIILTLWRKRIQQTLVVYDDDYDDDVWDNATEGCKGLEWCNDNAQNHGMTDWCLFI